MTKYEFIKYFNLTSDKSEYKSNDKLVLEDEFGYKYYLSSDNLKCLYRRGGSPNRFFGGNPFTEHNIRNYISKNIGDHIVIVNFHNAKNAKDEIIIKCLKHNTTYSKCWNVIKNGSFCNECGLEVYKAKRKNNIEELKDVARKEYDIEIVSVEYINNLTELEFICNKHRDKGVQLRSWANIISKTHSCVYCASESIIEKNTKTHNQYISELDMGSIKVNILGKYTSAKSNILVECKTCGDKLYMRPDHIKNGVGCGKCTKSNGEERISNHLREMEIEYYTEHRFGDCILSKRDMPFDFYIESLNVCIEYDGVQHYEAVSIFGGENQLKIQQANDSFKNEYCKENGIKLIRIPYWDFDRIEEILKNELTL